MRILMMTNTYLPSVCGVARSVATFRARLLQAGHEVLVVAPAYPEMADNDEGVIRVPAVQNLGEAGLRLPIPGILTAPVKNFAPDVVHVHHPFLLGDTGLRIAATYSLPVVFTHHTMYEHYTHLLPANFAAIDRFTIRLATEFANLCDHVVAPSASVAAVLRERGVVTPTSAIPTGIVREDFAAGDGAAARRRYGIPSDAYVVGHVGRLAPEKNLLFLTESVLAFLQRFPRAHYFVVGDGQVREEMVLLAEQAGLSHRMHLSDGKLEGPDLYDAYRAMDVMAFASQSETQGLVLAEAMAAGMPVVAVDATGVRDIVIDRENGRLLPTEDIGSFVDALLSIAQADETLRQRLERGAARTAEEFSIENCTRRLIDAYELALGTTRRITEDDTAWKTFVRRVSEEYSIWMSVANAVGYALLGDKEEDKVEESEVTQV